MSIIDKPWVPENVKEGIESECPTFYCVKYPDGTSRSSLASESSEPSPKRRKICKPQDVSKNFRGVFFVQASERDGNTAVLSLRDSQGGIYDLITNQFSKQELAPFFGESLDAGKPSAYISNRENMSYVIKPVDSLFYDKNNDGVKKYLPVGSAFLEMENDSGAKKEIRVIRKQATAPLSNNERDNQLINVLRGKMIEFVRNVYIPLLRNGNNKRDVYAGCSFDTEVYQVRNLSDESVNKFKEAAKKGGGAFYFNSQKLAGEKDAIVEPLDTILYARGGSVEKNVLPPHLFTHEQLFNLSQGKPGCLSRPNDLPPGTESLLASRGESLGFEVSHEMRANGIPLRLLHDKNQKGYFLTMQKVVSGGEGGNEDLIFVPDSLLKEQDADRIIGQLKQEEAADLHLELTPDGTLSLDFKGEKLECESIGADSEIQEGHEDNEAHLDPEEVIVESPEILADLVDLDDSQENKEEKLISKAGRKSTYRDGQRGVGIQPDRDHALYAACKDLALDGGAKEEAVTFDLDAPASLFFKNGVYTIKQGPGACDINNRHKAFSECAKTLLSGAYIDCHWDPEKEAAVEEAIPGKCRYQLKPENKEHAKLGLVFFDVSEDVRTVSTDMTMTSGMTISMDNPNSYEVHGNVTQVYETDDGMFVDQVDGKMTRTFFTNFFKEPRYVLYGKQLKEAAKAEPGMEKSYKVIYDSGQRNVHLQSTQSIQLQSEGVYH